MNYCSSSDTDSMPEVIKEGLKKKERYQEKEDTNNSDSMNSSLPNQSLYKHHNNRKRRASRTSTYSTLSRVKRFRT